MNLLLNIVPLLSTDSILPLSSQRRLAFFFDSGLLLLSPPFHVGLRSSEFSSFDQYEVLQMSSILNDSVAHCFEEAEQEPAILTCIILPRPFL